MIGLKSSRKPSQEEIFSSYNWWDTNCILFGITEERCDYIQSRIERVFGEHALAQQEVLDVGCGGGLISVGLLRRKALVVGIDPSQEALTVARAHTQRLDLGQNGYYEQGRAEALPYADGSFSVIVCLDVLEHVQDLRATIREVARVLAPGGVFVFDTINRTLIARLALIWIGERLFRRNGLTPGLHDYHHFIQPAELRRLLSASGLKTREIKGFMPAMVHGRLGLRPGWFTGVSYVGYATKGRG